MRDVKWRHGGAVKIAQVPRVDTSFRGLIRKTSLHAQRERGLNEHGRATNTHKDNCNLMRTDPSYRGVPPSAVYAS